MDICYNIFKATQNEEHDNVIFDLVLQEFLNSIDEGDKFIFDNSSTSLGKVKSLMNQYIYTSKYNKLFFEILAKNNYAMRHEIKDAMFSLGHLKNPKKNKAVIKKFLCSPIIQDISFNGKNKFTISSEQYGNIVMELASYYFRKDQIMKHYIKNNSLPNRCHDHAYFMSDIFADYYAITSLCKNYFNGTYYHSYTHDTDRNVIIDLCYNSIVDKDQYYNIFQPQDISVILNSKVVEELSLTTLKTEQESNRCNLLKIALYKQYLNSIGYQDTLLKAPSTKSLKSLVL